MNVIVQLYLCSITDKDKQYQPANKRNRETNTSTCSSFNHITFTVLSQLYPKEKSFKQLKKKHFHCSEFYSLREYSQHNSIFRCLSKIAKGHDLFYLP